jgi:hypothetical protein
MSRLIGIKKQSKNVTEPPSPWKTRRPTTDRRGLSCPTMPPSSSSSSSTLDSIFRLLEVANDLEDRKENRIEAATKVRL